MREIAKVTLQRPWPKDCKVIVCFQSTPVAATERMAIGRPRGLTRRWHWPFVRLRPRSLWRNRAPVGGEEVRRIERWLATARVSLAIAALVAVWIDPVPEIRSIWAYALLAIYIGQGMAIIVLLRSSRETRASFRGVVHAADVVWPALICLCTSSQSNSFFLFFLFVIAAAAYRWGLFETVITSISAVWLLWLETWALWTGRMEIANAWFSRHYLPVVNANLADFDPKRLLMRSVYLVVMGLLLGYLAEQQKKLRAERDERARMLGLVSMEAGLAGTLSEVLGELLRLYRASRAIVAARETAIPRLSVGTIEMRKSIAELQWVEPGPRGADTYLTPSEVSSCYARRLSGDTPRFEAIGLNPSGARVAEFDDSYLCNLAARHGFDRLVAISFSFGPELEGRVFLLEPELGSSAEEELRFLQDMVRQVGPAIYNVYLLRRLRKRAGALERSRLVRELHDGAVQSLIGVEMQVDVLRRSHSVAAPLGGELTRIQELLREEVLKLRDLMQQMKSTDVDARRLPGFLRDAVQRFQRETGIAARFITDDEELVLPQPVCRELARIAQEALVNVRKHSGAQEVLVQLLEVQGRWNLIIEDDGAGFPFAGRLSEAELDATNKGPAIIRERVRLIQGQLTIESRPGRGARVEVSVPQPQAAAHG